MTLDEHLLEKARSDAARLAAAEREALLARADYHNAVRRLHLGGGSLREIAEHLGLSHQRVQQIVSAAGGSWWQRVWQSRNARRDALCTFCGRPPSEVAKLIAGPNVFICDACVAHAEKAAEGADIRAFVLSRSAVAFCSFCRKRRTRERVVISTSDANICGDCLGVCRQILDHRAA